jgi:Ser/Thr protein kinase RdoA (MazF antagonist)
MTHFPVTNSNLSAEHLLPFLQERYDLVTSTGCHLLRAGINDTYMISGAPNFVFRVYSLQWRTAIEISEELFLLNKLKQSGISVSFPIADHNGSYIQTLDAPEGERYGVLFSYADGKKQHQLPKETHFEVGALLARMHIVTDGLRLQRTNYTGDVLLIDSLKRLTHFLPEDAEEMQFMISAQQYILEELSKANTHELRKGVVHLDFWFDNLNITPGNEITVFDFDFSGNGWLVLDIAYYISQLHNTGKYILQEYAPNVEYFLKGYESVITITEEEKRLVPILGVSLYFFYLGVQCSRYNNWSNSFLSEDYLKRYINGIVRRYFNITIPLDG